MKATSRAHILLPQDLVAEIDKFVGPRKRSSFLVETARAEIRRRKLLAFLGSDEPAWKDADHPELAQGANAWVRKLRDEGEGRRKTIAPRAHPEKSIRPGTNTSNKKR